MKKRFGDRRCFVRAIALAIVGIGTVPLASFASGGLAAHVSIKDETFRPKVLHVRAGTNVIWTNQDDVVHTVTSGSTKNAGKWVSGTLSPGKTFSIRFLKPGTYAYYCMPHFYNESMHASVVVTR
jgi:plastocyanin